MADEVYKLIHPYVEKDPTAFYTIDEFEKDVYGDSVIIWSDRQSGWSRVWWNRNDQYSVFRVFEIDDYYISSSIILLMLLTLGISRFKRRRE